MHAQPSSSAQFSLPATDRWSAALVSPILSAWRGSGLSFAGFCRLHQIDAVRLQYWVVRERQQLSDEKIIAPAFSEIRPLPSTQVDVRILLPRGITVSVPVGSDVLHVRAVVEALL
jgi:hypothetical protein